jgi:hypothetical protein
MATLNIQAHVICPQWNYTIRPRPSPAREQVREIIVL